MTTTMDAPPTTARRETYCHELEGSALEAVEAILGDLASRYDSSEDERFVEEAALAAQELPRSLRAAFHRFHHHESQPILIVSGLPVDQVGIGPTPEHWKNRSGVSPTLREEMLLVLFGHLLGSPIAWSTQQDGYLVHDILPIKGHEKEQLGSGSEELLTWHTEDAFHPFRGDYLGMLCLRNPDGVATTVATVDALEIPREHLEVLFEERFVIRPDESHLLKNKSTERQVGEELAEAYERIDRLNRTPDKIAVLFGDPRSPYMRLDPYFMDDLPDDPEAQAALDALIELVDAQIWDLVLQPGDYCFVDNFRAVHGRKPFKARFDGNDRWMKRLNIARDLRKSRSGRSSAGSVEIL